MRRVGCLLIFSLFSVSAGCATFPAFETYRKAAISRRVASADGTARRTAPPPEQAVVVEGWPYLFTRSQVRRLRRAGYRFDTGDLKAARHLYIGGFSAADLVQAAEDLQRYAGGKRTELAAIAAYRLAGFDMNRYGVYRKSKRSLTGYYNDEVVGGIRVWKAGLGLTVIGLALVVVAGGVLIGNAISESRCTDVDACDSIGDWTVVFFGSVAGFGAITATIGGIMLLATSSKVRRHINTGALDEVDASALRDFRRWRQLAKGKRTGMSLSLSPLLARGGGGLALRLQF